jgi:PAS domain S-box-containing protein
MAKKSFQKSEQYYRSIFDNALYPIAVIGSDFKFQQVNNAFCKLIEIDLEELIDRMSMDDITHMDDLPESKKLMDQLMCGDVTQFTTEKKYISRSGRVIPSITYVNSIDDGTGEVVGCTASIMDITERKKQEERLLDSETKIKAIFNQSFQFMCLLSLEGTLLTINQAAIDFAKIEEADVIGKPFWETPWWEDSLEEQKKLQTAIKKASKGEYISYETVNMNSSGEKILLDFCINPIRDANGTVIYLCPEAKDITNQKDSDKERKKLEKQLYQAQKMEVIGTLAGGIAHDFNNILGVMIGFSELALEDIKKGDPARYSIEQVAQAGFRAKDLVEQILLFSRQSKHEMKPVKVIPLAKEVIKMLNSTISKDINIKQKFSIQSDLVLADPTQLHQIFMNLCTNATHAMNEKGGILSVTLDQIDFDKDSLLNFPGLKPGPHLKLQVADTGHGIPNHIIDKIFDPFFTTKSLKEGTGLGLSVVHGIVKNHGGDIKVYSESGEGTTFQVYLPFIKSEKQANSVPHQAIPKGSGHLLLIDDEIPLIDLGKRMLERLGYKVTAISDSQIAWEIFQKDPDQFDMIITDKDMPHINGLELSKKIINLRSNMPIIMCTGFSDDISLDQVNKIGIKTLLYKPIIKKDIAEKIHQLFDHTNKKEE